VYRITATRGGPATSLRLYLDGASTASKLTVGLYADTGGDAGALLASATKLTPTAGAWTTVALSSSVNLTAGTHYWLGLLNPSDATGTLRWRDRAGGSGGLERTSLSNNLTGLPLTWLSSGFYTDGPVSGGAWGDGAPVPSALAVSPTSLALTAVQGGSDATTSLSVTNSGDGPLDFTVTHDVPWLRVAPANGLTTPKQLTVGAYVNGMSVGTHTGTITITAPGVPVKTVPVTFTVTAPAAGLVGAWGFDETAGATTADASGTGNTGTLSGATRTTAGRFGGALTFDGVNDWVTVPDAASLDLTTGATVEGWAYPTSAGAAWSWRTLAIKEAAGDLAWALYPFGDNGLPSGHARSSNDLWATGPSAPALNTWTHFAMTYDGATIRLFVNGTQVGTKAQTGVLAQTSQPLRFGGNGVWGEFFAGRLDELRIYDRALSAAQIQADMNRAVGT
jgi:hypothetical protein